MEFFKNILGSTIILFVLLGCANPDVVQISGDTYMLAREDHAGIFGSSSKLKAEVIKDANEFAKSKSKVAVPISVREKPVGNSPGDWATFEYQFKLVDKENSETKNATLNDSRNDLSTRSDYTVQHNQNITANVKVKKDSTEKTEPPSTDIYSELIKLDDLLKRGIINEAEFKKLKEALLSKIK